MPRRRRHRPTRRRCGRLARTRRRDRRRQARWRRRPRRHRRRARRRRAAARRGRVRARRRGRLRRRLRPRAARRVAPGARRRVRQRRRGDRRRKADVRRRDADRCRDQRDVARRLVTHNGGAMPTLTDAAYERLLTIRVDAPEQIGAALAARQRRDRLTADGALFIVAADHTARGMLGVPGQPRAMADRRTMLDRLVIALDNPRVDGVLASADILEDLVVLGALDGKVAVGTMNRGGLAGAAWELDDRFTAYDVDHLVAANLDAGKMLLRIDPRDRGTVPTLASCAATVAALNERRMMAMVEPIPYAKDASG